MSEEDDEEYRRRISEVLIRHGFEWVVTQAETQIAEGKPSSKQVSEREIFSVLDDPDFTIRRPRARRASLITSEPYSEAERLEILLQAVEAALVQRSDLERAVLAQIPDIIAIRYEPDSPIEGAESSYLGKAHELNQDRSSIAHEIEADAKIAIGRIRTADRDSA
jgi:hypothetical protein